MLLSFGDNSDDVTTTEHDCGAAIGRRLKISGVMAGMCWRKLNLIVFIRTKFTNNPRCQEFIFSRLDARTLSTVGNAKHVELQHYAREQIKTEMLCESRRANQLDT